MREECARIGGMPEVAIQPILYQPMIILNHDRAGKVLAEGIDRRPPNDYSDNQQPTSQTSAEFSGPIEVSYLSKTENHANEFDSAGNIPESS